MIKKETIIIFILALMMGTFTYFLLGKPETAPALTLTCNSFKSGEMIPRKYTCDGENVSPQLSWSGLNTDEAKSYALIVDDPDAQPVGGRTFVHWMILLPATTTQLAEGISGSKGTIGAKGSLLSADAQELSNDFKNKSYDGPCPPSGMHTYQYTLFALDTSVTDTKAKLTQAPYTAAEFKKLMEKHIVAESMITGTYTRAH